MADPTSFHALAGCLTVILDRCRYVVGHLGELESAAAMLGGPREGPTYSDAIVSEGRHVLCLEEAIEIIRGQAPYEAAARALAAHDPLAALNLPSYTADLSDLSIDDKIIVEARARHVTGPEIAASVEISGVLTSFWCKRSAVKGKARKSLVTKA